MDALTAIIIALIGGGGMGALVAAYFGRRKVAAEAAAIESQTVQSDAAYYRKRAEETREQMHLLEAEVRGLKASLELVTTQYEQRAGTLHAKIDGLMASLDRANAALDTANNTIAQLRQEVKDGNTIISELREKITLLLVEQAKGK